MVFSVWEPLQPSRTRTAGLSQLSQGGARQDWLVLAGVLSAGVWTGKHRDRIRVIQCELWRQTDGFKSQPPAAGLCCCELPFPWEQ